MTTIPAAPRHRSGKGIPKCPRFSIIIVNFNGGEYVQQALDSLARQTIRDFEVLLVDNGSTDGSANHLRTDGLPAFTLMAESHNHGFAAGTNLAAAKATGDWIVCLNPDAIAAASWLEEIVAGQARYPNVRMFASAQLDAADPRVLDGAGDAYLIFGMPWRGGFGRAASELPGEGECFSPCGASAVFDRRLFLEHGGFDEEFFCFCEDVDLGFRLRLAGENCMFLPRAVVHHVGGGLAGRASDFSIYHGSRNRVWTYAKNMPSTAFWITLPGHVALSLYLLARGIMTGRVRQTWRGMRDGLLGAARMRRNGRALRQQSVSSWQLVRTMVWNPFRMSQRKVHVREVPASGSSASAIL
ncbi:glycosyltransferase family 2 protein [Hyphomonas johnsonii]|uniref:Glycosyl transferase family 2 n=1 Tax=Hyphomonas johnsonii MHS-2 TaxID=1280950 RepID=A0A059FAF0_9PROT|nr:glycosyltransferase family 2 protein [Hyphomonas johnsonii]KCZ87594.1 glycosyl transferase family 2 [Hyphomonas johnsonii MHS-2]